MNLGQHRSRRLPRASMTDEARRSHRWRRSAKLRQEIIGGRRPVPLCSPFFNQSTAISHVRFSPRGDVGQQFLDRFTMRLPWRAFQPLPLGCGQRPCGRLDPSSVATGQGGYLRIGQIRQGGESGAQQSMLLVWTSWPNIGRHARTGLVESLKSRALQSNTAAKG